MSKKSKKINTDFTSNLSTDHLSEEQHKELQKIIEDITKEAKLVVEDYIKNPSDMSGSLIQIHHNSPFLDEE
tara:strand:+ start:2900 stop:3115 length:216 start_codon:yes stop_codon:yes gene_type:complete